MASQGWPHANQHPPLSILQPNNSSIPHCITTRGSDWISGCTAPSGVWRKTLSSSLQPLGEEHLDIWGASIHFSRRNKEDTHCICSVPQSPISQSQISGRFQTPQPAFHAENTMDLPSTASAELTLLSAVTYSEGIWLGVLKKKTHKSDLQPNHNSKWELNYINL